VRSLDDGVPGPISATVTEPSSWKEHAGASGWSAEVRHPPAAWPAVLAAIFGAAALLDFLSRNPRGPAIPLLLMSLLCGAAAYVVRLRPMRLAFENGRFTVRWFFANLDLPMDDILAFSGVQRRASTTVALVVHMNDGAAHRVSLLEIDPNRLQFIVDRLNAMLAAGGRAVETGYRGERLRVDPSLLAPPVRVETVRVETREADAADDGDEASRESRARK
jgi:hypothetical protein